MRRGICIAALLFASFGCDKANPVKPEEVRVPLHKVEVVNGETLFVCETKPRWYCDENGACWDEVDSYYSYDPCPDVPIE